MQLQGKGVWAARGGAYNGDSGDLQVALQQFLESYPMDSRASEYLHQCAEDIQWKVIETFDPHNKAESDYSRQVTGYIRSLRTEAPNRKRAFEEEPDSAAFPDKRQRVDEPPPEDELIAFRLRYPMDDRAFEYLSTAPAAAQAQVLSEFRPRVEGEEDYSSLITSLVKRARMTAMNAPRSAASSPYAAAAATQQVDEPPAEEELTVFRLRYPMDDRAFEYLCTAPADAQVRVLSEFRPRAEGEADYSSLITSFVKRERMAVASAPAQSLTSAAAKHSAAYEAPAEEELTLFRLRYPMDDRAFEYLATAPGAVQMAVITEFRPRTEGEADYSSLITSFVKRARTAVVSTPAQPLASAASSSLGPGLERLTEFRLRYPMDERAWDFLLGISGHTQEVIVTEFRPKREGDTDYSAPVTAFIRAMGPRDGRRHEHPPSQCQLDLFRKRFPMDDRAFEYLVNSSAETQRDALQNFLPKRLEETDFSRQLTAFLRRGLHTTTPSFGVQSGDHSTNRTWRDVRDARSIPDNDKRFTGGQSRLTGRLRAFRARYPMDDRAFDFLEQADAVIQETVLSEFFPKREGESDYSAPVTSYIKFVKNKTGSSVGGWAGGRASGGGNRLLEVFRRRYPMDDRAFDYLTNCTPEVQREVIERFKPKQEGESDYSGMVTSFIRSCRR